MLARSPCGFAWKKTLQFQRLPTPNNILSEYNGVAQHLQTLIKKKVLLQFGLMYVYVCTYSHVCACMNRSPNFYFFISSNSFFKNWGHYYICLLFPPSFAPLHPRPSIHCCLCPLIYAYMRVLVYSLANLC